MRRGRPYVAVEGAKGWREAVRDKSYVVKFASTADKAAYEKKDARLNRRIKQTFRQHLGSDDNEDVFISDDWWPNRCRYVTVSTRVLSHALIERLRGLLSGEFADWRIRVFADSTMPPKGKTVGGLLLYSDKVLVERAVLKAVDLAGQTST